MLWRATISAAALTNKPRIKEYNNLCCIAVSPYSTFLWGRTAYGTCNVSRIQSMTSANLWHMVHQGSAQSAYSHFWTDCSHNTTLKMEATQAYKWPHTFTCWSGAYEKGQKVIWDEGFLRLKQQQALRNTRNWSIWQILIPPRSANAV
jgi:hypothetical protein